MKVTYERGVDHCSPTPYVRMVTIKSVSPAENSDFLDSVAFTEIGWNAITKRGMHRSGQQVMFIPPESVLPYELGEELEITKYLSKGRVRVAKLRGNRSEGLIVDREKVEPFLPYIMKWEDPPSAQMKGETESPSNVSLDFCKFYQMPNILNEPDTFEVGEQIVHSEKMHGTSTRFGYLKHPHTEEYQLYVGSHNVVLKESEENLYWKVVRDRTANGLPEDILFFGEIFGIGVQNLHYDRKHPDVLIFAAMRKGLYLPSSELTELCYTWRLAHIEFHTTEFKSIEQIRELADSPSELTTSHMREGVVINSIKHPEKMAKCIGFNYWTSKKRTERH